MRILLVAAFGVTAIACGSQPSGPPCDVRTDRMGITLTWLGQSKSVVGPDVGVKLVELPDGEKLERTGPVLTIESDGDVLLRGQKIGTDYLELANQLEMTRSYEGRMDALYVAADADTTLEILDQVLAAVPYGYELRLLGWGKPIELDVYQDRLREVASVKKFEAALKDKPPGEKAVFMAHTMEEAVGKQCAPLTVAFGGVAGIGGEDKSSFMAREVPAALKECDCSIKDRDLVEYLMYSLFGAYDRPQRWIRLERQHGPGMAAVSSLVR